MSSIGVLYTQIGALNVDTSPLAIIELAQDTDITIRQGYQGPNGNLKLTIYNSGNRALDFNDSMDFYINGVDYDAYGAVNEEFDPDDIECLDLQLDVGESTSDAIGSGCDTGLEYPSPFDDDLFLRFDHLQSHKSWSYQCDVKSSDSVAC
jgi:hypothetical protein